MKKAKSTYDKALEINLNPMVYGTFAEIGAGQETANWFFRASASAGTVAKTISAYDMTMSDAIYGKCDRYVSRRRLTQMLDHEFNILVERLGGPRQENTQFFSFANTVRARGYKDRGECHGWLGLRFQLKPGAEPSEIFVHIRLLDESNVDQMEALGVVGVNLLYAAFNLRNHLKEFAESLIDNLTPQRVEVDMLKFQGSGYGFFDNRLCALQLVESGLTDATMFTPDGEVIQAADALYKKPILLLRGSFDPVLNLHLEMLEQSRQVFSPKLEEGEEAKTLELCEISMTNLLRGGAVDHVDFIDRANALQALNKTVLISRCAEFHRIATYLSRYTNRPVGIVLSIGLLNELFKPKWSENLAGGLLESFGRLFKNEVSLYVYPWKNDSSGEEVTATKFKAPTHERHLYQYLLDNGKVVDVPPGNPELLTLTGRDVQKLISQGDEAWRKFVPEVAQGSAGRLHGSR